MPNWCSTTYKCVGDPKEVKSLHEALKYIDKRKTTILVSGFGKWWLGNLIHVLGGNWEDYRCRGEIIEYDLDDENTLTINQSTAWHEQEGVRQFIEKEFPSIKVYFIEEEPDCEVFRTNDAFGDYFPERFFLESYEYCKYFVTIEEAAKHVSDIVGHEVEASVNAVTKALDDYVGEHEEEEGDLFYSFHEFEIINE